MDEADAHTSLHSAVNERFLLSAAPCNVFVATFAACTAVATRSTGKKMKRAPCPPPPSTGEIVQIPCAFDLFNG